MIGRVDRMIERGRPVARSVGLGRSRGVRISDQQRTRGSASVPHLLSWGAVASVDRLRARLPARRPGPHPLPTRPDAGHPAGGAAEVSQPRGRRERGRLARFKANLAFLIDLAASRGLTLDRTRLRRSIAALARAGRSDTASDALLAIVEQLPASALRGKAVVPPPTAAAPSCPNCASDGAPTGPRAAAVGW